MGLFSFLKNAGSKLFGKKEEAKPVAPTPAMPDAAEVARKQQIILLKGIVNNSGIQVNNLDIDVVNDTVILYGEVETTADQEKVILTLGNVNGIAAVDDRLTVTNPEPPAVFRVVQKGDSLSKIAKRYYGDAMKYPVIFEANRPMLSDPDAIYPGQTLRIPALDGVFEAASGGAMGYTGQKGDTLGVISKNFYGTPSKYMTIFNANTDILSDPNVIKPGQNLTIPSEEGIA